MIFKKIVYSLADLLIRFGNRLKYETDISINGKPKILRKNGNMIRCFHKGLILDLNKDHYIDSEILKHGFFEKLSTEWVLEILKPGMVVFDVGANFGYYSLLLSKKVGINGKVFAFEPSREYFKRLINHIDDNSCANIFPQNIGLSDKTETLNLFRGTDSASLYIVDNKTEYIKESIELITLDDFVKSNKIEHIDLIKVDIDGHEINFLNGASKTIEKFKPIIFIEFMQIALMQANSSVLELKNIIENHGYSIQSENFKRPYESQEEFLFDAMNCSHSVNIFCFPIK